MDKAQINAFDKIMGDIIIYLHPKFLKAEHHHKIPKIEIKRDEVEKYYHLLVFINQFYKKTKKYKLYFSEFYPETNNITKQEALEHHIHAYLEDSDILKNKILVFLWVLKGDLKKNFENKKELEQAIDWLVDEVKKVFFGLSKHRNPHHHKGMKFLDSDLVEAETSHTILNDTHILNSLLKPEGIETLKKKEEESFLKAKNRWIKTAERNDEEISGLINELFEKVQTFLYKLLMITHIEI